MDSSKSELINISVNCFATQYKDRGMHAQRSYPNEALIQFIASRYFARSITERQHIRVLELGCGSGANLWMLAKEGFDVYGLDSSSEALTLAMDHLSSKWGVTASVLQGSFTELPYNDGFFDVVVDVVSLQHLSLTDSSLALDEIVRVLRPGGEYFSYRLSDASVMFGDAKAIRVDSATLANIDDPGMPLANNGPVSFWSPSLARIMYSDAGLDLQGVERLGRTYSSGAFVEYLALAAVK